MFKKNFFISKISYLYCLIPAALVSGPFLPDLFLVIGVINLLIFKIFYKKYFYNKFLVILFVFSFYIIVRSLFTEQIFVSLKPSLAYLRFPLFVITMWYFLDNQKNFLKFFFYCSIVAFIFVLFDTYIQSFFGYDIFGYPKLHNRLSGPFGDELVVGSYVARVLPLIVALYILYLKKIDKILISLIFFSFCIILLSGERTAFALSIIYILGLFFLFHFKNKIKIFIAFMIILLGISIYISFNNKPIFERMFQSPLYTTNIIKNKGLNYQSGRLVYYTEAHETHLLSAYEIFKKNLLFGGGVQSYRYKCQDPDIYKNSMSCTTHPHNTLFQILAETGIIGFIFYFSIFIVILLDFKKIIFYKNIKKNFLNYFHLAQISLLLSFLQTFMFIIPSGNFFNNWVSIIYYLPVALYIKYKNEKKFL